jgi:ribonuclease HII
VPASDLLAFERPLVTRGEVVVGIDEVGRGALAGPLTVGAVVVRDDLTPPPGLTDSKLLTSTQRESLVEPIKAWATDWALGSASAGEIDAWGLRVALAVAATRAIGALRVVPTFALLDGTFNLLGAPLDVAFGADPLPLLAYADLAHRCVVKGDRRCASIAAASVLAKVHRDGEMTGLDEEFRPYGWAHNKGYGSPDHLEALRCLGATDHHRRSWRLPELNVVPSGDHE